MIGPVTMLTGNPVWWDWLVIYGIAGLGFAIIANSVAR